jgi:hypothetical protein
MTINIDQVPNEVFEALSRRAAEEGKSVPEVALEALTKGLGMGEPVTRKRDLSRFSGTWVEDPAVDAALRTFEESDEDLWIWRGSFAPSGAYPLFIARNPRRRRLASACRGLNAFGPCRGRVALNRGPGAVNRRP